MSGVPNPGGGDPESEGEEERPRRDSFEGRRLEGVSAVPQPTARRFMAQDLGVLHKKQHRVLANFLFGVFAVVYTTARGFRTPNARKNRTECP